MEKKHIPLEIPTPPRPLPWKSASTQPRAFAKTLGSLAAVACLAAALPLKAGQAFWDLNDPSQVDDFILVGNNPDSGVWLQDDDGNGFIRVTAAADGRTGAILFPDFDEGLVVKAFEFEMDVRLGDGTNPPADGFSINYASADDPAVESIIAGGTGVWAGTTDIGGTEDSLPEEGTRTGLGIGFDTWGFPGGGNAPDGADLRGISIRVDGVLIHQEPLPNVGPETDPDDPLSLETGPWSEENTGSGGTGENLTWQPLKVTLHEDGRLDVFWKGNPMLENFQSEFFPRPGRLVFGGRTGGSFAYQDIDNIRITTIPSDTFLISGLSGRADGFTVTINDAGQSVLDPNSVELRLNNEPVDFTITKEGSISSITHSTLPNFLPAGSTNVVTISAADTLGQDAELERTFTVRRYVALEPEWRAPAGSWDPAAPGYVGYLHQLPVPRGPGDGNSVHNAARQLAGGFIDPATGQPYESVAFVDDPQFGGVNPDGTFTIPLFAGDDEYINWNQDVLAPTPSEIGSFTSETPPPPGYPDRPIPGIPGTGPTALDTDWIAMEAYTYVELEGPRLYTLVVNSDDGFRVTAGPEIRSVLTTNWLGQFDGGKGSSDIQFDIVVPESGVYRMRLTWWEGTGGANLEFFHLLDDGTKVMFNDPYHAEALSSYQPSASPQPFDPALVSVAPYPGQGGIFANSEIQVILRNGTTATVAGNNVEVLVNGQQLPQTVATTGDHVRVTARPDGLLPSGANNVVINWSDSTGATYQDSYTFTVAAYQTLPEWLARPLGSGSDPGMTLRLHQLDYIGTQQRQNRWSVADQQLEGLFGPSVATESGTIVVDYVNMEQEAVQTSGFFNADGGYAVDAFPGIPGNTTIAGRDTDNIAIEFLTYIEFPETGLYRMGVASDDGFRVIARESWGRLPLRIESPASIEGWIGAVPRGPQGAQVAPQLPVPAIEAEIVAADPIDANAALNNAAAISGNIALIHRGAPAPNDQITRAREAGAIGVIVVNQQVDAGEADPGRMPIEMGGISEENQAIPAVMIMKSDGDAIQAALAQGPVTASIGGDPVPTIGQFNDGRGHEETVFGIQVTQPGVYPFRLTWFEGGGGASVEWYMLGEDGTRALINHPNNVDLGLRAFRTAPAVEPPTEVVFNQPTFADGQISLTWTGAGVLQEATDITGPWSNVDPQPTGTTFTAPTEGDGRFYRLIAE
jgi:hypothetical protein